MDDNMKWLINTKVKRTMEALEKNNMRSYFVQSRDEVINIIESIVKEGEQVSFGGSVTLDELNILEYLRCGKYNVLDRYKEGLTEEEKQNIQRQSFFCDTYFTSSNAITEHGELYNVDGNGNRVAAMIFGPRKVIVIAGINKIVKDLDAAIERVKNISAPVNTMRLNKNTPCATTGYCMNCNSSERICREYTVIKKPVPNRISVILVNDNLGY